MNEHRKRWALAALLLGAAWAAPGCKPATRPDDDGPLGSAVGAATSQTCITVQRGVSGAVDDTQVAAGDPNRLAKNYGGSWTANAGVVAGGARQTLIRFDLGAVPPGSTVVSAQVTLTQINDGAATVRAHRITSAWSESTVTWNSFGGAYDPSVAATFVNGGPTYAGPVSFDATALAQGWVNDATQNHGVLLEQDPTGATRFWTSDDANLAERPKLQLCWAAPTCSDGIQNQGERGVDCGGPCAECAHPPASQIVSSGDVAKSAHYKAVHTTGQPTQTQDGYASPNYRVQGGLVGANGSLP